MDYLPELMAGTGLAIITWFANRVVNQLDNIHNDLKSYSDRLTKLETQIQIKCAELQKVGVQW
jgi:flagellar capping protein FliD